MKLEKTEIWIATENALPFTDGRTIRGFLGNMYKSRSEFHGHKGDDLIYRHPLIQYKNLAGLALIVGLKEGAYLLKALPKLPHLDLHYQKYKILTQEMKNNVIPFGLTSDTIRYCFKTPWIGLNEKNYQSYVALRQKKAAIDPLLEMILIGNLLSMSKSIGYVVDEKIWVKLELEQTETIEVKHDVKLISFQGGFTTNFLIPDLWGIGKFSSRGYGTVVSKMNGEGHE